MADSYPDGLRPMERRMRKLAEGGADDLQIVLRFQRTPLTVRNMLAWSELPRDHFRPPTDGPCPIERRVLRWRDEGAGFDDLAARFRRRPACLQHRAARPLQAHPLIRDRSTGAPYPLPIDNHLVVDLAVAVVEVVRGVARAVRGARRVILMHAWLGSRQEQIAESG